jgi:hypothetical protein
LECASWRFPKRRRVAERRQRHQCSNESSLIGHLSYSQVPALAKRHKVEAKKDSASAQELLAKQVSKYDEAELCKLLLEISLLDSAYQRSTASRDDILIDAAKRYRVDTQRNSRKPWPKSSPRNETRKQSNRRFARRQTESTHGLDLWRSANLHSTFCGLNGELPFWHGTAIYYFLFARHPPRIVGKQSWNCLFAPIIGEQ